jgi:hypothetical protein
MASRFAALHTTSLAFVIVRSSGTGSPRNTRCSVPPPTLGTPENAGCPTLRRAATRSATPPRGLRRRHGHPRRQPRGRDRRGSQGKRTTSRCCRPRTGTVRTSLAPPPPLPPKKTRSGSGLLLLLLFPAFSAAAECPPSRPRQGARMTRSTLRSGRSRSCLSRLAANPCSPCRLARTHLTLRSPHPRTTGGCRGSCTRRRATHRVRVVPTHLAILVRAKAHAMPRSTTRMQGPTHSPRRTRRWAWCKRTSPTPNRLQKGQHCKTNPQDPRGLSHPSLLPCPRSHSCDPITPAHAGVVRRWP